jgi:hypothetical protein
MAVPKQIQKQSEEVQQLYKDLEEERTASPEGEAPAPAEAPTELAPASPDSATEEAPAPAPIEPGDGTQEETFEQKYRTLQGMFNTEVPRLNAENQELTGRVTQLEQLISTMQTATPTPEPEPVPAPKSVLTPEEEEEYGESIDIMRKVSQEVAADQARQIAALTTTVNELRGTIVPRVEDISNRQAQTADQTFWSQLTDSVPNWRDINENQDFQTWLLETDPLSGMTRQSYLEDAQRNLDVVRVASFFSSWEKASGTAPAQPSRIAPTSELERQVAPGRGRNTGTPGAVDQKTYSSQDIAKFFDDVRRGVYRGREEERDTLERDIFAAQAEGRIVNA